jgi:hypothetical protein
MYIFLMDFLLYVFSCFLHFYLLNLIFQQYLLPEGRSVQELHSFEVEGEDWQRRHIQRRVEDPIIIWYNGINHYRPIYYVCFSHYTDLFFYNIFFIGTCIIYWRPTIFGWDANTECAVTTSTS